MVRDYESRSGGLRIDPTFRPSDLTAEDQAALRDGLIAPQEWAP